MMDPYRGWVIFVTVCTVICMLSEALRWRRLVLIGKQIDSMTDQLAAHTERLDVQSGRITTQVKRVDDQVVGLGEALERTRLHRKLLDLQHERLNIHGAAIGVVTVFDDPRKPEPEPEPEAVPQ